MIKSSYRPTQLDFAFLYKTTNTRYYLDFNPGMETQFILNRFLDAPEMNLKRDNVKYSITSKKGITVAVALKSEKQGPVLIFAPHKRGDTGVEGIVNEIIKQLDFINNSLLSKSVLNDIINDLINYFSLLFGADYLLGRAVKYGILYHHGDFPQFIREIIEDSISQAGFRLIVCTNTLTEGVNLPIRTIVIHSTKRFNPTVRGKYEYLGARELKNLVGRAGRAGKETKGLIIVPHDSDFRSVNDVMTETNNERIHGNLYNRIIRPVTQLLVDKKIKLDEKLLTEFEQLFPDVIESIDISLLELLSEEVGSEELMEIVMDMVSNTFSYYQSNENEKDTLIKIFVHRANALLPYINTDDFKVIKGSGVSISVYEMINEMFNFDNEIWHLTSYALSEDWLFYVLDEGIFRLDAIKQSIEDFNSKNRTSMDLKIIKLIIINWMKGFWYSELSTLSGIPVNLVLELINTIFQFRFQNILSSVIRIAEIKNEDKQISEIIINWTKMFQYGIDSQLKLDLLELGLTDRVAILFMDKYSTSGEYNHQSKNELKQYIKSIAPSIHTISPVPIPNIAFRNLINFIDNI
jgi:hypothetical protein